MTPDPRMLADMNWFAVLDHHATRTPDKAITVFEGETTTYQDMARRARELAGGLAQRGVDRGAIVALLSYNCPEFLETVFAANYLGAIAMPINWRLAAPEVRYILEHSGARVLVCDEPLIDLADEATKDTESSLVRVCLSAEPMGGWTSFADLRGAPSSSAHVPVAGDDLHRLMYTSGTTGRPKGVMITHANLAWRTSRTSSSSGSPAPNSDWPAVLCTTWAHST
jgi:fatty-acyl-CoA synthase